MTTILCLCHDVTEADIERAVRQGYDHPETVKRFTAALTGPCQGRACRRLVLETIARLTNSGEPPTSPPSRVPVFPVRMGLLAGGPDVDHRTVDD